MKINTLFRFALSVFAFFALTQVTFAIGISPVRNELNINPGESAQAHVTIINDSELDYYVEPVIEVFLKNDENGYPIPAEFEESDIHNIRKWITIPDEKILVPANDRVTVEFDVEVPNEAEPGGKYATIGFVPSKEDSNVVTVKVQANSILLINVNGDVIIDGDVTDFGIPEEIFSDNVFNITTNFENKGNTHVKPTGTITIKNKITDEFLEDIGLFYDEEADTRAIGDAITVNINGGNVLPNSNRIFSSEWTDNIRGGEYTLYLNLEYKEDMDPITREIDISLIEDLKVDNFNIAEGAGKTDFVLTLTNNGNIYEKLIGNIEITNDFGYKVDEIIIPEDIEYIEPGTTKTFTFNWLDKNVPGGGYKAVFKANHGISNTEITAKVSFGVGYVKTIAAIVVLLVVIFLIFFGFKKRKRKKNNSNLF